MTRRNRKEGRRAMFDYHAVFQAYCEETGLPLRLSFEMPDGYEDANGTFDPGSKTVFINAKGLEGAPDHEKAFYLFHELRHAAQYLCPDRFDEGLVRSLSYVILYDGTCCRSVDGVYRECRLEGGEEIFTDLYLGQPYEVDANRYAYEKTKALYGDLEEIGELYRFWLPRKAVPEEEYDRIYKEIDERTGG